MEADLFRAVVVELAVNERLNKKSERRRDREESEKINKARTKRKKRGEGVLTWQLCFYCDRRPRSMLVGPRRSSKE